MNSAASIVATCQRTAAHSVFVGLLVHSALHKDLEPAFPDLACLQRDHRVLVVPAVCLASLRLHSDAFVGRSGVNLEETETPAHEKVQCVVTILDLCLQIRAVLYGRNCLKTIVVPGRVGDVAADRRGAVKRCPHWSRGASGNQIRIRGNVDVVPLRALVECNGCFRNVRHLPVWMLAVHKGSRSVLHQILGTYRHLQALAEGVVDVKRHVKGVPLLPSKHVTQSNGGVIVISLREGHLHSRPVDEKPMHGVVGGVFLEVVRFSVPSVSSISNAV
mmetsp:Transcript_24891/g.46518  ORF Transcript_24891/g.46518 Transcript_24891/m.46518 type:complete len:275 (+) Transcript_24891:186-1010(+)